MGEGVREGKGLCGNGREMRLWDVDGEDATEMSGVDE